MLPSINNRINRTQSSFFVIGSALLITATYIFFVKIHLRAQSTEEEKDKDRETNSNGEWHTSGKPSSSRTFIDQPIPSYVQRELYKLQQRKSKIPLMSMKKPMYDNIYMLDKEHNLLCTVSMKKAKWYINKGIAEWSSFREQHTNIDKYCEDAKCIRLLFTHSGAQRRRTSNDTTTRSNTTTIEQESTGSSMVAPTTTSSESTYLCSTKRNICVSCGKSAFHIRHYIVPYVYRSLLPKKYKEHMSHDIVILCPDCHFYCERRTKRRMKDMESALRTKDISKANIRRDGKRDSRELLCYNDRTVIDPIINDPMLCRVRSCALALMRWKTTLPQEQLIQYDNIVRSYLKSIGKDDEEITILNRNDIGLTKHQLQKAIDVKYRTKNPNYIPGAQLVVQSLNGDEHSLKLFVREWRTFFIEMMQPKFMPLGWKVDNPVCTRDNDEDE